ncbi:ArgS-related anticodon-binding protein NrtL [Streptomyces sp. WMMC905]|uniref:ArgS-related anticodon-binding protein NrtL n=1 Tax=Streptomyces sp. WMMC905 TaxID=3404123 RepID=UPI003B9467DE
MTPVELSRTVLDAVRRAAEAGELPVSVPKRAVLTTPGPGGSGDFATAVALQLAGPAGRSAREVAEVVRAHLVEAPGVAEVRISGPGFLNISLDDTAAVALVREILLRGSRYGFARTPEAPEARPTPDTDSAGAFRGSGGAVGLHAPCEVRAVVVMDSVARLLRAQGVSVLTRCAAAPPPEWRTVLGVDVDVVGAPTDRVVRPVPVSGDPLPLGRDAARWALLHPAAHDQARADAVHLAQRESNPLFRVRYAHARIRALIRNAADLGFGPDLGFVRASGPDADSDVGGIPESATSPGPRPAPDPAARVARVADPRAGRRGLGEASLPDRGETIEAEAGDGSAVLSGPPRGYRPTARPGLPGHPRPAPTPGLPDRPVAEVIADHAGLLALLADHPRVLASAARRQAPDRLARHLVTVADAVPPLLADVLPRGAEKPSAAHRARLALAEAVGLVLAGGLSLLGVTAPDHL